MTLPRNGPTTKEEDITTSRDLLEYGPPTQSMFVHLLNVFNSKILCSLPSTLYAYFVSGFQVSKNSFHNYLVERSQIRHKLGYMPY